MDSVVEAYEEVHLDFAGPLPDELNKDAYILVAIDKSSNLPTANLVSIITADVAIKFNGILQTTQYTVGYDVTKHKQLEQKN